MSQRPQTPRPEWLPPTWIALEKDNGEPVYIDATRIATVSPQGVYTWVHVSGVSVPYLVAHGPREVLVGVAVATTNCSPR